MEKMLGKVVVVSGAANGLGKALCIELAIKGAEVIGLDRDAIGLKALAEEIHQMGLSCLTFELDVTNKEACWEVINKCVIEKGRIDILVNNAGITHIKRFEAGEVATLRKVMEVNLWAAVYLTEASLESIKLTNGQIVAVSSVAGFAPLIGRTGYAASKHALIGFFRTLRTELLSEKVSVLIVCPSFISTNLRNHIKDADEKHSSGKIHPPEKVAKELVLAMEKRRRFLITGNTGKLSYSIFKFLPNIYEKLMIRKLGKSV